MRCFQLCGPAMRIAGLLVVFCALCAAPASAQVLDKLRQLESQKFWDNRDWDWYVEQIPFFECPDEGLTTTYYYRWELLTKHLTYGSPDTGYVFTEFIDRPFWSGTYGAISCPAGHQLYEARWLRQPRIARDYAKYWFRTPGAQPRNYSCWIADSVWALQRVHPDREFTIDLLPDLIKNYEGWERRHFVPEVGLFWQTGHDDGMEFNINSRQTKDILRGAPSFRPSFNAYMAADARAIARIADAAGDRAVAERFRAKADALQDRIQALLWDPQRKFFFPMLRDDEERDGHVMRARTLTYQSGRFAGDPHGRELIGYVPWQFDLVPPDRDRESAWKKLFDRDGFAAEFGPSTVERNDPQFLLQKSCCWWSGQSWPYATTQTLQALARLLQRDLRPADSTGPAPAAKDAAADRPTAADYVRLLQTYSRSHRKDGRPYLAEALHPDTGSFEGHDAYNHSEHYFHSGFCDLIVTGLVGFLPGDDSTVELRPLAPESWDFFALDDLPCRGRRVSVVWDRDGKRYGRGAGLQLLVDGVSVARRETLGPLRATVEPAAVERSPRVPTNFVVNNDGTYYPRITASYSAPAFPVTKLNDGNYWYLRHPPNRWTCEGSSESSDWVQVDFGVARTLHTVQLYPLDDREFDAASPVRTPEKLRVELWSDGAWKTVAILGGDPADGGRPVVSHRANTIRFAPTAATKLRVVLTHPAGGRSGLTEIEAWGDVELPLPPAPPPPGNLAYNPGKGKGGGEFPKASASHTSRFDRVETANDGVTNFLPTPNNRWTSYESKATSDWLEIDFGKPIEFRRVELAIFDDRGGVQAPERYQIECWDGAAWKPVRELRTSPPQPVGGQWNEAKFAPETAAKLRIVFTHRGAARSGVSEVLVWND